MKIILPVTEPHGVTARFHERYRFGLHRGVDLINTNKFRKLVAPHDGIVYQTTTWGKGKILIIENGSYKSQLAHLDHYDVRIGDSVKAGQLVGEYGNTGFFTTGKHVHWELRIDNKLVDPMKHLNEGQEEYMKNFHDSIKDLYWEMLGRSVADDEMEALMASSRDKAAYERQKKNLAGFEERKERLQAMYKKFTGKSGKKGYGKEYVGFQITHETPFSRVSSDLLANWKEYKKK